jgi:hypothetical protein
MNIKYLSMKTGLFVSVIIWMFSCCENKHKKEVRKTVTEWIGEEIEFPAELQCVSMMKDTACIDLYSDNYKILLYVDSLGCTNCRTKLAMWEILISQSDTIFENKPDFLFFFNPKVNRVKELKVLLRNNYFGYPVFIDKDNEIKKLNDFPEKQEYQCFLLDKDNKVVMVGNPVYNSGIWTLYKKIINGNPL